MFVRGGRCGKARQTCGYPRDSLVTYCDSYGSHLSATLAVYLNTTAM
jgi:hypothetical protein